MKKNELLVFTVLLLAVSLLCTRNTAYLLFSLLVAWVLFQLLVKRSKTVIVLLISLAASVFLFDYAGGKILQRRMAKEFYATLEHYPKPDPKKGFNPDGIRTYLDRPARQFSQDAFNMIFLGDSFTQGYMVRKDESFPFQLGGMLEKASPGFTFNIANFGWISSSPLLDLRRLKKIGANYHPDLVVLCLDMTDFHDDIKYRDQLENPRHFSPFTFFLYRFNLANRWAEFKKGFRFFSRETPIPEQRYFIVNQPLEQSRKYLAEIEKNILGIDTFVREELKAKFVLVLLPRHIQYNAKETPQNKLEPGEYTPMGPYVWEPFTWLEEFGQKVKFPVFSLLNDFKNSQVFPTCYATDPHWNSQGHAVAARGMLRVLEKLTAEKYLDLPLTPNNP